MSRVELFAGMTLRDHSSAIGKYRNFFYQKKIRNRPYFDRMALLGNGNLAEGYRRYHAGVLDLRRDLADLYYLLQDLRALTAFSVYLKDIGMFKNEMSFLDTLSYQAFSISDWMRVDTYDKYKRIVSLSEEWLGQYRRRKRR